MKGLGRRGLRAAAVGIAMWATLSAGAPARALADDASDPYKQHMSFGIKLYQDGNYDAALAEFTEAYRLRPGAAPLLDQALCHKAAFRYTKAITALEQALSKHASDLSPAETKSATDAVAEMRALLGYVTVDINPRGASLRVDGDEAQNGKPFAVAPGRHVITAKAEGFAPAEVRVDITSGERRAVPMNLVAVSGYVVVSAPDERTSIAIDQQRLGFGTWAGMLPAGAHVLSLEAPDGRAFAVTFIAPAGGRVALTPGGGIIPRVLPGGAPGMVREPPPRPPLANHRGPFLIAEATFAGQTQPKFINGSAPMGAAAIYAGYRLNNVVGIAVLGEYAKDSPSGETVATPPQTESVSFTSVRLGADLRLTSRGIHFRFVSNLAIGAQFDSLDWSSNLKAHDHSGLDPFARLEEGIEFDLGGVLVGTTLQEIIAAPVSLGGEFGGPILSAGPTLHIGYGRW